MIGLAFPSSLVSFNSIGCLFRSENCWSHAIHAAAPPPFLPPIHPFPHMHHNPVLLFLCPLSVNLFPWAYISYLVGIKSKDSQGKGLGQESVVDFQHGLLLLSTLLTTHTWWHTHGAFRAHYSAMDFATP